MSFGRAPGAAPPRSRRVSPLRLVAAARSALRGLRVGAVLGLLLLAFGALAQQPVPALQARVTDQTGTLSVAQRQQLEAALAAIEQRHGAQVAVLMVRSTQPEPIEAYAIRVAEAWKLGRGQAQARRDSGDRGARAIDDGVLIVVAQDDRRVRIEVGYGLEGAIPDATARRIIAEAIAPRFRAGDYAGGLQAAIDDLGRRIAGEALPAPRVPGADGSEAAFDATDLLAPLAFFAVMIGLAMSRLLGRVVGATAAGAGAGFASSGLLASAALGGVLGLGVFLLVLLLGGAGGRLRQTGRRTIGDAPVELPGGWGSGGSWGGGGGGGGFGGGGGGFGGGGASGDW